MLEMNEIDLVEYVVKEIEQNFNDNFVSFAYEGMGCFVV
jgi:hypothetical protein